MTESESSILDRLPFANKNKDAHPEPYPNPAKIAVTWTPDTIVQTGRTPTRGFGGRVFFYDEKSRPVPVEGTLIVHGFDDSSTEKDGVKRFEFTPEQFTRHFSQSDLGASYSIWIPWDAMGGQQKRISLVSSFRTTEDKLVQGIPATMMLPGTAPEKTEESELAKLSPQYQRYVEATQEGSTRSTGLTTTTIHRRSPVPNSVIDAGKPGITIPQMQHAGSKMAAGQPTPSIDIEMLQKRARSGVLPASAQMPLNR
ncbi:MAG: hypothetical protein ACR2NZ_00330 [Rubripirellula sp.]